MSTRMFLITAEMTNDKEVWNSSVVACGSSFSSALNAFRSTLNADERIVAYGWTPLEVSKMHSGDIVDLSKDINIITSVVADYPDDNDSNNMIKLNDDCDCSDDDDDQDTAFNGDLINKTIADQNHPMNELVICDKNVTENNLMLSDKDNRYQQYSFVQFKFVILPYWIKSKMKHANRYAKKHPKKIRYLNAFVRTDVLHMLDRSDKESIIGTNYHSDLNKMIATVNSAYGSTSNHVYLCDYTSDGSNTIAYLDINKNGGTIPTIIY